MRAAGWKAKNRGHLKTDVLPQLGDARLLWAAKGSMRLAGFERIEGADYAQTWSVELG